MDEKLAEDLLAEQRMDYAAAFVSARTQLRVAQGVVTTKTLEVALWAWRWGRAVNDIHGVPTGRGNGRQGALTPEQMLAYCIELGLPTKLRKEDDGRQPYRPTGGSTVNEYRYLAVKVSTEDHLRELVADIGHVDRIIKNFHETEKTPEARDKINRSARARRRPTSHSKYAPPQDWHAHMRGQGYTRGQIGAIIAVTLYSVGPERSIKLWESADSPGAYDEANDYQHDVGPRQ